MLCRVMLIKRQSQKRICMHLCGKQITYMWKYMYMYMYIYMYIYGTKTHTHIYYILYMYSIYIYIYIIYYVSYIICIYVYMYISMYIYIYIIPSPKLRRRMVLLSLPPSVLRSPRCVCVCARACVRARVFMCVIDIKMYFEINIQITIAAVPKLYQQQREK